MDVLPFSMPWRLTVSRRKVMVMSSSGAKPSLAMALGRLMRGPLRLPGIWALAAFKLPAPVAAPPAVAVTPEVQEVAALVPEVSAAADAADAAAAEAEAMSRLAVARAAAASGEVLTRRASAACRRLVAGETPSDTLTRPMRLGGVAPARDDEEVEDEADTPGPSRASDADAGVAVAAAWAASDADTSAADSAASLAAPAYRSAKSHEGQSRGRAGQEVRHGRVRGYTL